jgi:DNA-binding MarR family transcriptional regulator
MTPVSSTRREDIRRRQHATRAVRDALQELRRQLARLNYRVGSGLGLKDVDLDCLDILSASGPMSPSALARDAGVHPATMTGILDRLERGGWIARERDPNDRRAVLVRVLPDRFGELLGSYAGMSRSMNSLLGSYSDKELEVIADFLQRCSEAGREATDALAEDLSGRERRQSDGPE